MELDEKFERELSNTKSDLKRIVVDELTETINNDKKEVKNKIEKDFGELKKRLETESNEIRDKMQFDKKGMIVKFEEVEEELQKEAKLVR